ncbi:hypothetical protein LUZ61_014499 [Rhynchospora tenuis]|uniref:Uncharacterized protein n=1 Tax=Rhynchospora tenuis TaxID=198213 RepID=A0AAD5WBB8_9POAL|nr:hypothetical protein LUZ61_014499 [Rhynchospora tenuis]
MPRSSRHKSSHKSHRRSSPVDWSGSDEERESEARVSKDSESEKRKSSHSKEVKDSSNGYASLDHGKKRKERVVESKDESGASDRWDSGLGRDGDADALVEKRSKGDVYSSVDTEKERDKEKYVKEESKSRSSRKHDERNEEKRRYKEEKEKERDKEREREKERGREKEKEKEKEKDKEREKEKESDRDRDRERDRERDRDRDRDRERSSRREKYEDDKREKERYEGDKREKERYEEDKREKERHEEDKRDKHRYDEVKREKDRYDEDKRDKERHDDAVVGRKRESETGRIEEANSANKDVDIITETDTTDREQREKNSKRRRDEISSEEKNKEREREKEKEREREKEKERHRDDYSKSRSTKEQKSESDKYKDKHRDKDRDRDDRREREYYDYKSSKEGNRASESRYKKSKGSDADPYDNRDEYSSKHKDSQGSKRNYEATEDRHERELEKEDVERSRGEYRYGEKEKEKEKEKVDSSPGKIRLKGSPGSSSYHDREQNRHRSKPVESPKKELMQEDRPRTRTSSSTGERTPSRLRDEKLNRPRDDAHSLDLSSEIASSTPRSDNHASPKFATEKSPSNTSLKYSSGRGGSGSSKYRDRDRDREREFDVPTPDKLMIPKREPTPIGTSNRSNSSSNFAPLPYEDGDNRRESGPDRRFHKRGGHAHGNNNWNGAPNWAAQVNNGFMPLPPGPPPPSGFHHFGGPPPPLFGIRPPPMKLGPSGVGVPFVHDPLDRFSGQLRGPYGWHNSGGNNPLEDSFPPNLWGPAGNGVFGAEPFWDQNRHLPTWRAQSEMPNKELINVSQKDIGAPAPAIKMEDLVIIENLPSESVDIEDDSLKGKSSVETYVKDQIQQEVAPEVDKKQEASVKVGNFWESYISRIDISRDLVDLETLKKCTPAIGELEKHIGADMSQVGSQIELYFG